MSDPPILHIIADSFREHHNSSARYLRANAHPSIATLGPPGSSSEAAALSLLGDCLDSPASDSDRIHLYTTFEEAARSVIEGVSDLFLVANGYERAADFYFSTRLAFLQSFAILTPPYGLACRQESNWPKNRELLVASHHAPLAMLETLIPADTRYRVIDVPATPLAAKMVAHGQADLCITNERGAELYGLRFIGKARAVQMVWSIFRRIPASESTLEPESNGLAVSM